MMKIERNSNKKIEEDKKDALLFDVSCSFHVGCSCHVSHLR